MEAPSLQSQAASYDIALTTFSPDGRLFQVEYAFEAVRMGTPILGIRGTDGVVLTAVLRKHVLQEPNHNDKIFAIDDAIGAAISGLSGDARTLVTYGRQLAQIHQLTFGEPISVKVLGKKLSDHIQTYTQQGGTRPYGVSMLMAGVDSAPQLYLTTPIGTFWSYKAQAVGNGADEMNTMLEREYRSDLNVEDALKLAFRVHKATAASPLRPEGFVAAKVMTKDMRFTLLDKKSVKALFDTTP